MWRPASSERVDPEIPRVLHEQYAEIVSGWEAVKAKEKPDDQPYGFRQFPHVR
jgi:hypothetical protein